MNSSFDVLFKEKELTLKKLYENKKYSNLLNIIINEIFIEDIKNLNIDYYYACNINQIMEHVKNDINKKLLNNKNKSYESIINDIIKYWKNRHNKLKAMYSTNSGAKLYLSSKTTQTQIKFISKNIDFINHNISIESSFTELEQLVLEEIKKQKNPFHIVSSKYPLDAIVIAIEKIYEILQYEIVKEEDEKNKKKKAIKKQNKKKKKLKKSKDFLYLYNIISIKNATFIMPTNLQSLYFKLATKKLSDLISEGKEVDIKIINEVLEKLTVKEAAEILNPDRPNNTLVSNAVIEEYYSDDTIDDNKKSIVKHYYSDFDETFNPDDVADFNIRFGVNQLKKLKEDVAIEIIKCKRKEK